MKNNTACFKFAAFLLLLCAGRAAAQERQTDWIETPDVFTARYMTDLSAGVSQSGSGVGTMRDSQMDVFYQHRLPVTGKLSLILGAGYRRTDLFLSGGAPLPVALQSASVRVGGEWKFNERWSAGGSVSPGVYGDTDLDRSGDVKVPVSLFARYTPHPGLTWLGGLAIGFYGRNGALPFIGALWQINDRWRLNAALPMARLTYRAAGTKEKPLDLFVSAGIDGGLYQVAPDFGNRFGQPQLNGNTLSVQQGDARTGVSTRWRVLTGELAVGYQFARRYKYEQADEVFDVAPAPYLSASLSARF